MKRKLTHFRTALATLLAAMSLNAQAQGNITRLIVPFPAGGGTDNLARALSQHLQTDLGETVIVENRPGAGGNLALDYVAAAPPDGKVLVVTTNSLVINPLVDPRVKFNAQKSFTPVALLARSPVLIVGRTNLPFRDIPGLITYAKSNPGRLTYGSCGLGSIHQVAAEQLKAVAGIDIVHVPYKGCGPAMVDLAGGQIDLSFNSLTTVASYQQAKRVEILAVTNAAQSALLPNVASVASSGLRDYSFDGWYAVLAPAGTPDAVVKRINESLNKGLADVNVKKILATGFLEPLGGAPAALAERITKESAYYAPIIKTANIKLD